MNSAVPSVAPRQLTPSQILNITSNTVLTFIPREEDKRTKFLSENVAEATHEFRRVHCKARNPLKYASRGTKSCRNVSKNI